MEFKIFIGLVVFMNCLMGLPDNQQINYPKATYHPVHMSYTKIEFNEQRGKFEILFKLFVDDFDQILYIKYGKQLNLLGGRWESNYLKTINAYIFEHFKMYGEGKDKTRSSMKFVKKEFSEDSIWLYYDFNSNEKSNTFEVHNSLMTDLYHDQNNLLIFVFKGAEKAQKFNHSKVNEVFSF